MPVQYCDVGKIGGHQSSSSIRRFNMPTRPPIIRYRTGSPADGQGLMPAHKPTITTAYIDAAQLQSVLLSGTTSASLFHQPPKVRCFHLGSKHFAICCACLRLAHGIALVRYVCAVAAMQQRPIH
jgi:hypothetical protein